MLASSKRPRYCRVFYSLNLVRSSRMANEASIGSERAATDGAVNSHSTLAALLAAPFLESKTLSRKQNIALVKHRIRVTTGGNQL
ncbi:hypothetical protein Y032_0153g2929 [Ancylostoma ceylanicum]|uniref:Uncharacterized protein n=1 Tax=Ancylostoma ceylanicum TaxID=53326 RepID=A0A016T097_9BILA|nr:hypothetical protein Y032_0153g2929 [Ancylostoma ceylanicum]